MITEKLELEIVSQKTYSLFIIGHVMYSECRTPMEYIGTEFMLILTFSG